MKLHWISGALLATALTIPASAQISVYIGHPPPRARYERRDLFPVRVIHGSVVTGHRMAGATSGCRGGGIGHPIEVRAGFAPITGTTNKAGSCGKGTGIATSRDDGDK